MRAQLSLLGLLLAALAPLAGGGCSLLLNDRQHAGTCGDNAIQADLGETCDDGNLVDGDGCSSSCLVEECGNGVIDSGEECDDGAQNDNESDCTRSCKKAVCGDGYTKTRGKITPYEVCDDGNMVDGDGCNSDCSLRGRVKIIGGEAGGMGYADGVGSGARFGIILGLSPSSDGSEIYLSDFNNCIIRKFTVATGIVETLAGKAGECGITTDGDGLKARMGSLRSVQATSNAVYFTDGPYVRRMILSSKYTVETCGTIENSTGSYLKALAYDPSSENLYLADETQIAQMPLSCTCSLYSGSNRCKGKVMAGSTTTGTADGQGTSASFSFVTALAFDSKNQALYVADHVRIRKLDLSTMDVTTFAGSTPGYKDAVGTSAKFETIDGITASEDSLYTVGVTYRSDLVATGTWVGVGWGTIRKVDLSSAEVSTFAGIRGEFVEGHVGESDGFGSFVRIIDPSAAVVSGDILYVGEGASIRSVSTKTGQVATAAGVLVKDITYYRASSLASRKGFAYVPSRYTELLEIPLDSTSPSRKLGLCSKGSGTFPFVEAITADDSAVYVADTVNGWICKIDLEGKTGTSCCDSDSSCKEKCSFVITSTELIDLSLNGFTFDGSLFYLADRLSGKILVVDPKAKTIKKLADLTSNHSAYWGLVATKKYLYTTNPAANQVFRLELSTGAVRSLGSGLAKTVDGKSSSASFCHPAGLITDGKRLFVGEGHCEPSGGQFQGHSIRMIDLSTDQVTTLLGPGPKPFVVEDVGPRASVNFPAALVWDSATEALYSVDQWDNVLLKID
jgi:cysteine-rich repeat protein